MRRSGESRATFDRAGWDDPPSWAAIAPGHNTGLVQVGSGHHDLLQVLINPTYNLHNHTIT